jgi:hypothetical protein
MSELLKSNRNGQRSMRTLTPVVAPYPDMPPYSTEGMHF